MQIHSCPQLNELYRTLDYDFRSTAFQEKYGPTLIKLGSIARFGGRLEAFLDGIETGLALQEQALEKNKPITCVDSNYLVLAELDEVKEFCRELHQLAAERKQEGEKKAKLARIETLRLALKKNAHELENLLADPDIVNAQ